ncbi:protein kish isoform X1 [Sorghum bicolor]|uniref:protein kish isoform X1 n=1 Tax=Sorghum bicolor TaxID=4558 RepID=UPI000B425609|nr:protein kish isoform X1 [Sorghum bicolor]|eukprot:XP_021303184.1 protein kish isoform X1 [Sorghum bicolor]
MSALFNFNTFLTVVLLVICTCTYIKMQFPAILNDRTGFRGFFWKAARIGLAHWLQEKSEELEAQVEEEQRQ